MVIFHFKTIFVLHFPNVKKTNSSDEYDSKCSAAVFCDSIEVQVKKNSLNLFCLSVQNAAV